MANPLPFGIDPSLLGSVFDASESAPVTAEEIRDYARAAGESDPPFFSSDPVAPATFCLRFRGPRFFHPAIPRDAYAQGFDAGRDIELGAPVRPGDVISTRDVLHDLYEKTGRTGSMVFVVTRQTMTNQRGEKVAIIDSRFMVRGDAEKA